MMLDPIFQAMGRLSPVSTSKRWSIQNVVHAISWLVALGSRNLICDGFSVTSIKFVYNTREIKTPFGSTQFHHYNPQNHRGSSASRSSILTVGRATISPPPDHQQYYGNRRTSSAKSEGMGSSYLSSPSRHRASSFEQRMREALFRGTPSSSPKTHRSRRRGEREEDTDEEGNKYDDNRSSYSIAMTSATKTTRTAHHKPPNLVTIESLPEYKRVVGEESERIVAVRFHASYCRACRAMAPAYYQLVRTHPHVVFVDVPVSETTAVLHQGLRVPSLPFAHIYYPQVGLVEECKLLRKHVSSFEERLDHYVQGYCPFSPSLESSSCWEEERDVMGERFS